MSGDTLKSEEGKPDSHNFIGVALSTDNEFKNLLAIEKDTDEWLAVKFLVEPLFDKFEREGLDSKIKQHPQFVKEGKYLDFPIHEDARRKVELSLPVLYRAHLIGGRGSLYYFEAKKEYSTFYSGASLLQGCFALGIDGTYRFIGLKYDFPDYEMVPDTKPYGVVIIEDQPFLILYRHYYEHEEYFIYKITDSSWEIVIRTAGPGC